MNHYWTYLVYQFQEHFILNRGVDNWNRLPPEVVKASSKNLFKKMVDEINASRYFFIVEISDTILPTSIDNYNLSHSVLFSVCFRKLFQIK
ncbi:hypothetical protein BpHYR1_018262 [Brachionus plicatilis]|uniref:Uncharacterized protein n=1 Tax=Brachionus plicatilis TaxID=10195 RepID=A0A3M7PMD0_BRAPC|nr:hypothetical protein BpHYR1_018262 [Brachionus plicatilis]